MIINYDSWIIINPRTILLGDIDGINGVNMADLILLIRYFQEPNIVINHEAANIKGSADGIVTTYDLYLLSLYFARPGGFGE